MSLSLGFVRWTFSCVIATALVKEDVITHSFGVCLIEDDDEDTIFELGTGLIDLGSPEVLVKLLEPLPRDAKWGWQDHSLALISGIIKTCNDECRLTAYNIVVIADRFEILSVNPRYRDVIYGASLNPGINYEKMPQNNDGSFPEAEGWTDADEFVLRNDSEDFPEGFPDFETYRDWREDFDPYN